MHLHWSSGGQSSLLVLEMAGEMADNIPFGKLFHHGPQEMWNVALIALFERFSDNKLQV